MFATLVVMKNDKKRLLMSCKHARCRPSKATSTRPRQHYQHTGCQARISFTKLSSGLLKCMEIQDEHNHPLSSLEFAQRNVKLSNEEEEIVKLWSDANVKPGKMQRLLDDKFEKYVPLQKLRNIANKLKVNFN